jgi:hypothetical protein
MSTYDDSPSLSFFGEEVPNEDWMSSQLSVQPKYNNIFNQARRTPWDFWDFIFVILTKLSGSVLSFGATQIDGIVAFTWQKNVGGQGGGWHGTNDDDRGLVGLFYWWKSDFVT